MASVKLINVTKMYDSLVALKEISIDCHNGEFVGILGPAGAGKTSLLKIISGLESVTSGEVYIDDQPMNELAAEERDTTMVFESYSLYPHFSVFDNIAFPLRAPRRKLHLSSDEIQRVVRSVAEMLEIGDLWTVFRRS